MLEYPDKSYKMLKKLKILWNSRKLWEVSKKYWKTFKTLNFTNSYKIIGNPNKSPKTCKNSRKSSKILGNFKRLQEIPENPEDLHKILENLGKS